MTKNSDKVKRWRRRFRLRVLAVMGGKCVLCGYDTCDLALDVHHIDPNEKDFTFAMIRASPRALSSLEPELRRCVLLCKTCHVEVHAGVTTSPHDTSFDEEKFSSLVGAIL